MPRKQQGWITFQSSEEERQILEQYCKQSQRTKTEILRELVRNLSQQSPLPPSSQTQAERKEDASASELKTMKVSARNCLKGTVKKLVIGTVNAQVTLEIAPGIDIVSIITRESVEQLNLAENQEAYAVIKSSNVMIAKQ